jgi:serine/threonine protein kinase
MIHDGHDYRELLDLVRSGKIETTKPEAGTKENLAVIVKYKGKKYLVKKASKPFIKFDARLKYRVFGSPFLSVMKKVECAIADGCDLLQRICLIEEMVEREGKGVRVAIWIVLEYLEGEMLLGHKEIQKYTQKIPEAIREIHRYKLTHRDCNLGNFIISDGKVKIIDIHFYSDLFFRQMFWTICKVKKMYDLDIPIDGVMNNILFSASKMIQSIGESFQLFFRKEWKK